MVLTSTVSITFSIGTLQNNDIFFLWSNGIDCWDLQIIMSGWTPILLNSFTECWVGLVFISSDDFKKGTKVKWINNVFDLPYSFENCLIASTNGKLSISPTVPPISHITKSSFVISFFINSFIRFVIWGITWTVFPRYPPFLSFLITSL